jgi:hypothetical protein
LRAVVSGDIPEEKFKQRVLCGGGGMADIYKAKYEGKSVALKVAKSGHELYFLKEFITIATR